MKPSFAPRLACCLLMAALLAAGGCAYTTVTAWERMHAAPPAIPAGLDAVMPPVVDRRTWPAVASTDQAVPDVRIFSPAITDQLRHDLVASGLFKSLPAPEDPAAKDVKPRLTLVMTQFAINNLGTNAWVVPQLVLDGLTLPVFTGAAVYSRGRMDLGAYLLPSSRMGVVLAVKMTYQEVPEGAVLEREYLVRENMNEISERKYLESVNDATTHGVVLGREEGEKALRRLADTIAGDPAWLYLPQLRQIMEAEIMAAANKPLDERMAKVEEMLPFLSQPLAMSDDEAKVLRDGYLTAEARVGVVNGMRVIWLDLPDAKALPADQAVTPEMAEKLFDDPKLLHYQIRYQICDRIIALAWGILSPSEAKAGPVPEPPTRIAAPDGHRSPNSGVANDEPANPAMVIKSLPTAPAVVASARGGAIQAAPSPGDEALRQRLSADLAAKVRGDVRLQAALLKQAEKAIGPAWPAMRQLLAQVNTPLVNKYLSKRAGK